VIAAKERPGSAYPRLTRWLLGLCALAITHGSLYPWVFRPAPGGAWAGWNRLWSWLDQPLWTTGGDVIGNIILFVPLGMLAWRATEHWRCGSVLRLLVVTLLSLLFALALQVAQIWLPTRSPAVSDVVWNAAGLGLGVLVWRATQAPIAWLSRRLHSPHVLAHVVAVYWLLLQWWPLLPQLNRSVFFTAWWHLGHVSAWSPLPTAVACVSLLVVMHLLREVPGRWWVSVALVLTAHAGSFLFVQKAGAGWGSASNSVGWLLALVIGGGLWRCTPRTADVLVALSAAGAAVLSAWMPWVTGLALAASPSGMGWVPILGLLQEPRVAHTAAFLWAGYWTLAILILGRRQAWPWRTLVLVLTVGLGAVVWVQRWIPGQQADMSTVLLPGVCAALLARFAQRQQRLRTAPNSINPSCSAAATARTEDAG
jgi:VanZ like family